jgi:hypothetical protein
VAASAELQMTDRVASQSKSGLIPSDIHHHHPSLPRTLHPLLCCLCRAFTSSDPASVTHHPKYSVSNATASFPERARSIGVGEKVAKVALDTGKAAQPSLLNACQMLPL